MSESTRSSNLTRGEVKEILGRVVADVKKLEYAAVVQVNGVRPRRASRARAAALRVVQCFAKKDSPSFFVLHSPVESNPP